MPGSANKKQKVARGNGVATRRTANLANDGGVPTRRSSAATARSSNNNSNHRGARRHQLRISSSEDTTNEPYEYDDDDDDEEEDIESVDQVPEVIAPEIGVDVPQNLDEQAMIVDEYRPTKNKKGTITKYIPGVLVTVKTLTPLNKERIEKPLREIIWQWYKFFPETTEVDLEYKLLCQIFHAMDPPFRGTPQQQRQFQKDHANVTPALFNTMKNYIVSEVRKVVKAHWEENNHTMPDKDLLLACGDRSIDLSGPVGDPTRQRNLDHFVFYWDKLLPKVTAPSVDSWDSDIRYYNKLSPKNPGITASDEAFLCLCIKNYWDRWQKMFELKRDHPGFTIVTRVSRPDELPVPVDDANPDGANGEDEQQEPAEFLVDTDNKFIFLWGKYKGKYTIINSGSNRSGGWSHAGKVEYHRLWHAVKTGRKAPETLAKETLVYESLRSLNGITAISAEQHRLENARAVTRAARAGPVVDLNDTFNDSDIEG